MFFFRYLKLQEPSQHRYVPETATSGILQPSLSTITRQGLELVELLREAEKFGYSADDIQVALAQGATDPVDWLNRQWPHLIETVQVLVTTRGKEIPDSVDDVGILSPSEAKEYLRQSKGDVWSAVARAIQQRQKKVGFPMSDNLTEIISNACLFFISVYSAQTLWLEVTSR